MQSEDPDQTALEQYDQASQGIHCLLIWVTHTPLISVVNTC